MVVEGFCFVEEKNGKGRLYKSDFPGLTRLFYEPKSEQKFKKLILSNPGYFGIKKVLSVYNEFPDLVIKALNDDTEFIEVELKARNFIHHGHDPDVDYIYSYNCKESDSFITVNKYDKHHKNHVHVRSLTW